MSYRHILASVQRAAKNYPNGIEGLAQAMGKNSKILANKLNPNSEQNQLTVIELAEILDLTQDKSPVDLLAALHGRITTSLEEASVNDGEKLSLTYLRIDSDAGKVSQEIAKAESPDSEWGDQISPSEGSKMIPHIRKMLSGLTGMLNRLEGKENGR